MHFNKTAFPGTRSVGAGHHLIAAAGLAERHGV